MAPPHLSSRPKAETISVEDLITQVKEGRIRVPTFQRPPRWRAAEVKGLLDSIWHGYPVGTLLFWRKAAPSEQLRLGNLEFDAAERSDAHFVVDGQQRVTSLANALMHPHPTRSSRDIYALWFDLETQVFVGATEEGFGPTWIPLNRVLDAVELQTWWAGQAELHERTDLFRTALQLGKRVREYQLPAYIVESEEQSVLQIIFTRLNNAGVAMRKTEVFRALNMGTDDHEPVQATRQVFQEAGLGTWNNEALVQALRVAQGEDLSQPIKLEAPGSRELLDPALTAIGRALDFVRDDLQIPHVGLLPSRYPVMVLVRFFQRFPEPHPRNRRLLRRWFWRGVVNKKILSMNNPRLRQIQALVTGDESLSVQALLHDAGCPDRGTIAAVASALPRSSRKANAVEERVGLVALCRRGPRNVHSGEVIDVSALVEDAGAEAMGPVREGTWRIVHPRFDGLDLDLDRAENRVRDSHLWGPDRVERLAAYFNDFLVAACEPEQSDHPALGPELETLGEE